MLTRFLLGAMSATVTLAMAQPLSTSGPQQATSQTAHNGSISISLSVIDWQAVQAITGVVALIVSIATLLTVIIGYKSINESVLSRDAPLLTWAMQRMTDLKDDLEILRQAPRFSPNHKAAWDIHVERAAYQVSVELQRLAYLANSGLLSEIHLKDMWGPSFVEAWELLGDWVKVLRIKNGEPVELTTGAYSRKDFESFAMRCKPTQE